MKKLIALALVLTSSFVSAGTYTNTTNAAREVALQSLTEKENARRLAALAEINAQRVQAPGQPQLAPLACNETTPTLCPVTKDQMAQGLFNAPLDEELKVLTATSTEDAAAAIEAIKAKSSDCVAKATKAKLPDPAAVCK